MEEYTGNTGVQLASGFPVCARNELSALRLLRYDSHKLNHTDNPNLVGRNKCEELVEAWSQHSGTDESLIQNVTPAPARQRSLPSSLSPHFLSSPDPGISPRWGAMLRVGQREILTRSLRRAESLARCAFEYESGGMQGPLPEALDGGEKRPMVLEEWSAALDRAQIGGLSEEEVHKFTSILTLTLTRPWLEAKKGLSNFFQAEAQAALFLASGGDHQSQIQALLDSGLVRADVADRNGATALHVAAKAGAMQAVQVLLKSGSSAVNGRAFGEDGVTALHHACATGNPMIVSALLNASADPDMQSMGAEGGFTALHYAALKGHYEAAKKLLEDGFANVSIGNEDGVTPLHAAVLSGSMGMLSLLVAHKADVHAQTNEAGMTPAEAANQQGHSKLYEFLIQQGGEKGEGSSGISCATNAHNSSLQPSVTREHVSSGDDQVVPVWDRPYRGQISTPSFPSEPIMKPKLQPLKLPVLWRDLPLLPASSLPDLEVNKGVSQLEQDIFHADGVVLIRSLFDREMLEMYRPHICKLADETYVPETHKAESKDFKRVTSLSVRSEACKRLVHDKGLARIAAQILGVEAVSVVEESIFFKERGDGITRWHQDHVSLPLDTDALLTAWLVLTDIPFDGGGLRFAKGSHLTGEASPSYLLDDLEERFELTAPQELRVGDVSFHGGWTIHGADANHTAVTREAVAVCFVEKDALNYTAAQKREYPVCDFATKYDRRRQP